MLSILHRVDSLACPNLILLPPVLQATEFGSKIVLNPRIYDWWIRKQKKKVVVYSGGEQLHWS